MQEYNALVSIIIPVYNGSNYLKEAIASALNQTYENIEVILINDGSNDNGLTREIALSFKDKIRYFEKENGGVASALNLGIRKMKGEYFSWLSHDDIYYDVKIEEEMKLLSKNPKSVVWSNFDVIDENSNIIVKYTNPPMPFYNKYELILYTRIHGCTLLIPKKAFLEAGMFDEDLKTVQDNHMWLRIAKEGYGFLHVNKSLIQSRQHKEQGSVTLKTIQKKEVKKFFKWAFEFVKNEIMKDESLKKHVLGKINA